MTQRVVPKTTLLIAHCRVQIRFCDIDSQIDKLLFHVIHNSCF